MFFLGGQINCSTTIHSCSDILRLLSASEDSDAVDDPYITGKITNKPQGFALNGLFKSVRGKKYMESREAGMESSLLQKIEKMDFREQIKVFYTAYSKVCTSLSRIDFHVLILVLFLSLVHNSQLRPIAHPIFLAKYCRDALPRSERDT